MPSTNQYDPRAYALRKVSQRMEDICVTSPYPMPYETMFIVTTFASMDPNLSRRVIRRIESARKGGYLGRGIFQRAWKQLVFEQWGITVRKATTDVPFQMLYSHFYPNAGVESFLLREPYVFVKDMTNAGGTGIIYGPKGAGKTDHALWDAQAILKLKAEQAVMGADSILTRMHQRGRRLFRQAGAESDENDGSQSQGYDFDAALTPAAALAPTLDGKTGSAPIPASLGLYHANDVRLVTNVVIRQKSPWYNKVQLATRMSEFYLHQIDNDEAGIFSLVIPDEMGIAFNKHRAMTIGHHAIDQMIATHRKNNSAILPIAQSAEHQLPDSIKEAAQTKIVKLSHEWAIYTVQGLFVEQKFRDVPGTALLFETQENASFMHDILPSRIWEFVAEEMQKAKADEEDWTHRDSLRAARKFIFKNRASAAEIQSGKSGLLRSEIRYYLGMSDPRTGKPYTAEYLANFMECGVDKIQDVAAEIAEEDRQRAAKKVAKAGYSSPVDSSDSDDDGLGASGTDSGPPDTSSPGETGETGSE